MKKLLLLFIFTINGVAGPLDTWTSINYPSPGAALSAAYGNDRFVALAHHYVFTNSFDPGHSTSDILTSSDGITWTNVATLDGNLSLLEFRAGRFFAMCGGPYFGDAFTSFDGVQWNRLSLPNLSDITHANGLFYAATVQDNQSTLYSSPDLVSWALLNAPPVAPHQYIEAGNGVVLSSHDSPFTFQNGFFLCVSPGTIMAPTGSPRLPWGPASGLVLAKSSDGVQWTPVLGALNYTGTAIGGNPRRAAFGRGYYVAATVNLSQQLQVLYTTTLLPSNYTRPTNWTVATTALPGYPKNGTLIDSKWQCEAAFGNDTFVIVAFGYILHSGILDNPLPFQITEQPASRGVTQTATARFSVNVQSLEPVAYQWTHSGTNLPNATNALLTLTNVSPLHAGPYQAHITSAGATLASQTAFLTVNSTEMHLLPALVIPGQFGDRYLIEARDQLNPDAPWIAAATITLTNTLHLYVDPTGLTNLNRFYRATYQSE